MSLSPSYSGRDIDERSGSRESEYSKSRWVRGSDVPERTSRQKAQGRAFHKLISGIQIAEISHGRISHLVLTSAPGTKYEFLNRDFQRFYKRLTRSFGRVPYCKIKTKEGFGVLHVLLRTRKLIPQKWISENWNQVHAGSSIVDIRRIYGKSRKAAGYLATQYCSGQGFERLSSSFDWIKKGSTREWRGILSRVSYRLPEALELWRKVLLEVAIPQLSLVVEVEGHVRVRKASVGGLGGRASRRRLHRVGSGSV